MANPLQIDRMAFALKNHLGASDGQLARPAVAESASYHDAPGLVPGFEPQQAANHHGELLRNSSITLCTRPAASASPSVITLSSFFLLMSLLATFPNGWSSTWRRRSRQSSRIERKGRLLARSPMKPSESWSSAL